MTNYMTHRYLQDSTRLKYLQDYKIFNTFLPLSFSNRAQCFALSKMVSDLYLPILKHLRVLSFSGQAIRMRPDFLGELIHLR